VQGRGEEAGHRLMEDARALQEAGAFAVVMEVVPSDLAKKITHDLHIPTIGIGAGVECDAQVLVWQDMAGLRGAGKPAKFVKQYASLKDGALRAVKEYKKEVESGAFPTEEQSFK